MALKKFEKKKNPDAGFASAREMSGVAIGSAADLTPERQEMIPVQLIAFHEENDYRNIECGEEDLDRLADAIDKQGFLGSLIVTERPSRDPEQAGKRYVLLSGERRLRAVGRLMQRGDDYKTRFASLPCTVKSGFSADPERRQPEHPGRHWRHQGQKVRYPGAPPLHGKPDVSVRHERAGGRKAAEGGFRPCR